MDNIIRPRIEEEHIEAPKSILEEKLKEEEEIPTGKLDADTPDDLSMLKLKDMFSISVPTTKEIDMLSYIYGFFDKLGVQSMGDLSQELYILQSKLGRPAFGQNPLTQIYQYLKILSQAQEINQVKKAMESNGV